MTAMVLCALGARPQIQGSRYGRAPEASDLAMQTPSSAARRW